jgi:hypothetical protein
MTKEGLINKTLQTLVALPPEKAEEVADFADYVLKKHEETLILQGMQTLVQQSETFDLLNDEEDLYTMNDIKEKF